MLRLPVIRGVIDRRILVNYRVDPEAIARIVPAPFRPKTIHGYAIGGICLIRLKHLRPKFVPSSFGMTSENAAHRIAVEWDDENGIAREAVFIPRRDSSSRFNSLAGGRIIPGIHHHATFKVREEDNDYSVALMSDDGETRVSVMGRVADALPSTSIFHSLDEASRFFETGSLGYSATEEAARFHGLSLRCETWRVEPLDVRSVESSFFDDLTRFPAGAAAFDCALLMRGIEHEWESEEDMCCACPRASHL
ncbi:MAG TPA: DUF2071 domain-containing protein [Tepidisphaeraceae bacterium]|nr:DUF2071 domain-containing protein [Tepidisphaeraceae bacterium]